MEHFPSMLLHVWECGLAMPNLFPLLSLLSPFFGWLNQPHAAMLNKQPNWVWPWQMIYQPYPPKTPPAPGAHLSQPIALWAVASSTTNINRGFASWAKVVSCTTFPTNHSNDTGLDGSLKRGTFVSLRPFIRCKQILIYYSPYHLQRSPHSLRMEGKISEQNTPISASYSSCSGLKQHRILIKFPSRLCA